MSSIYKVSAIQGCPLRGVTKFCFKTLKLMPQNENYLVNTFSHEKFVLLYT